MSAERPEFFTIDRKVAGAIIHQINHMRIDSIPEPIRKMSIPIDATGKTVELEWLFNHWKSKFETVANYLKTASEDTEGKRTL